MRNFLFLPLLCLAFVSQAQNQIDLQCFKSFINPILSIDSETDDYSDLAFLQEVLQNRKIVILGENSHGDGLTFEAKTRLIKYLAKELGFNTIALEGGGFWEVYYSSLKIKEGRNISQELDYSWLGLWSKSEQVQAFLRFLDQNKALLNIWGIDNQGENFYFQYFPSVLKKLIGDKPFTSVDYESFKQNFAQYKNYLYSKFADTTQKNHLDYPALRRDLKTIKSNLFKIISEDVNAMIQAVKNIENFFDQMELYLGSYEEQNRAINMRDEMMAENLIWWLNKYPESKVIIWTANFHAAHNLDQVIYKENDDFYQMMKPLGHRLKSRYGDQVFSIAFTSLEGETAVVNQQMPSVIKTEENTWEYGLAKLIENKYAFINFENIRKQTNCTDLKFNSHLLGYKNKKGKWFQVFDGMFFIRTMERSAPKK